MKTINYARTAFAATVIAMASTASASADMTNHVVSVGMYLPMGYTWCGQSYYDSACHFRTFIVGDGFVQGTVESSGTNLSTHSFSVTYTSNQIVIGDFTGRSVLEYENPYWWSNGNAYIEIKNWTTGTPLAVTVNPSTVAWGINGSSISYADGITKLALNGSYGSDTKIVLDVVSTVPEPTSVAMLLGGIGLIGALAFRNRTGKLA